MDPDLRQRNIELDIKAEKVTRMAEEIEGYYADALARNLESIDRLKQAGAKLDRYGRRLRFQLVGMALLSALILVLFAQVAIRFKFGWGTP